MTIFNHYGFEVQEELTLVDGEDPDWNVDVFAMVRAPSQVYLK